MNFVATEHICGFSTNLFWKRMFFVQIQAQIRMQF